MSTRTNVYLSVGLMILMLLTIGVGGYFIKRANDAVDETKRLILEGREIGNKRGNQTLGAVSEAIIEAKQIENFILTNLTDHIMVANDTNNDLHEIISNLNQTNEQERSKAVDNILKAIQNLENKLEQKMRIPQVKK